MSMRLALLARQTEVSAILQSNMQMMEIPSPEKSLPSQVPLLYMYCAVYTIMTGAAGCSNI